MNNAMKMDRLLSIIVHLLNHDLVAASALVQRFEVSQRTIQRDMETIVLAGIPIYTLQPMTSAFRWRAWLCASNAGS